MKEPKIEQNIYVAGDAYISNHIDTKPKSAEDNLLGIFIAGFAILCVLVLGGMFVAHIVATIGHWLQKNAVSLAIGTGTITGLAIAGKLLYKKFTANGISNSLGLSGSLLAVGRKPGHQPVAAEPAALPTVARAKKLPPSREMEEVEFKEIFPGDIMDNRDYLPIDRRNHNPSNASSI